MRAKHWCFTLNNPTAAEEARLTNLVSRDDLVYLVYGRERGENGTFHFQGFISFHTRKTLSTVKGCISDRLHLEVKRGTITQAIEYCKKEGDFEEFGEPPECKQGKRTDWDRLKEFVEELGGIPDERRLLLNFPALYARYPDAVNKYVRACLPLPQFTHDDLREGWQQDLFDHLMEDPDDRSISFVVDADGGSGKTWFCQYMLDKYADDVQYMRVAKRDDLAYAICDTKRIYLFDVPRSQMEFLQYSILEQLKDRLVFSPKYSSGLKTLYSKCHVVVFSNEAPDLSKLSGDRVDGHVITIT